MSKYKRRKSPVAFVIWGIVAIALILGIMIGVGMWQKSAERGKVVGSMAGVDVYDWEVAYFTYDAQSQMLSGNGIDTQNPTAVKEFWNSKVGDKTAKEAAKDLAKTNLTAYKKQVAFAEKNGSKPTAEMEESVNAQIAQFKSQYTDAGFLQQIQTVGFQNEQQYREFMLNSMIFSETLTKLIDDGTVKVEDKAVQEEFDKNYKGQKQTVTAKHILFDTQGKSDEEAAKVKATANDVYNQIKNGSLKFDDAIEQYNEDPGMKENPDGYTFGKGEMVAEFETAAFALEKNGMSEPVQSQFGYHIILVTDFTENTLESTQDTIREQLETDAAIKYVDEQAKDYKLELKDNAFENIKF